MTDQVNEINDNYIVSSLVRGLNILSTFTVKRPALKISEIVELTGLDHATVFRFVYTLEKLGYLIRDKETKRYHQGVKMLSISLPAREGYSIRELALPIMFDLSKSINETIKLDVLDGIENVTLALAELLEKIYYRSPIGHRSPAYCTAQGKVLLAYQPIQTWDKLISKINFVPLTERTIVDPKLFREELQKIRLQGYAIEDSEFIVGLGAISAPIFDHHSEVAAAVNISSLSAQILNNEKTDHFIYELKKCASAISTKLGYFPELSI